MSRKEPAQVLNLDDIEVKRRLMSKIGSMTGLWDISLTPRKLTRSLNANAYYWAAIVGPWTEWLREQWGDPTISTEQAHIELKRAVLGVREKVNENTGEVMELTPTTHDMDQEQFGLYIENATVFLADFASIVVLPSELFHERKSA
jgi:hypothetical protein